MNFPIRLSLKRSWKRWNRRRSNLDSGIVKFSKKQLSVTWKECYRNMNFEVADFNYRGGNQSRLSSFQRSIKNVQSHRLLACKTNFTRPFKLIRTKSSTLLTISRLGPVDWVEETISGTVPWQQRELGTILHQLKPGDVLITAEISRFARSLKQILEVVEFCKLHSHHASRH